MGTTIYVKDYLGTVLSRGTVDMWPLMASAQAHGLLLLGGVDEYDDTVFNRHQTKLLLEEWETSQASQTAGVDAELAELRSLAEIVMDRAHRYLVFNGD